MNIMEIVLLAAGGIVFILSFLIPMKKEKSSEETRGLAKEEIKTLVSEELEAVRGHVDDVVEEAVTYSIEKTERSLERLSNEKIMAVNEYSDTVLSEIHKNHEEVMFLYDMLNDKHINLKNTVSEINRTVKEAKETKKEAEEVVNTFQRLAPEAVNPLNVNRVNMPQASVGEQKLSVPKTPAEAVQKPVAAQTPVMTQASVMPQVFASTSASLRKSAMTQEPVRAAVQPAMQTPAMMQEPAAAAAVQPAMQTPAMMQEPAAAAIQPAMQTPVMMQEPVMSAVPVTVQEQPVRAQEPIVMTAPVMVQEPGMVQETMMISPQIISTPHVFASAPTPVAVQIPIAPQTYTPQQSLSEPAQEFESPLPPGTISFTQETDRQGRNYNDLIMEMYQNGKSNVAIARELNLGVGEVKLVIDLYKNRRER